MRSVGIVFEHCCSAKGLASCTEVDSSIFRDSSPKRLLNDSTNGFSKGESGGSKSSCSLSRYTTPARH